MGSVKCVVVGSSTVGKTAMMIAFTTDEFPQEYVPTVSNMCLLITTRVTELSQVFDNYSTNVTYADSTLNLVLLDTSGMEILYMIKLSLTDNTGQDDYDCLRPLSYPNTDVFMLCFSVVDPASLQSVKKKVLNVIAILNTLPTMLLQWVQEIALHCQGIPFLLVGTKVSNPQL